MRPKFYCYLVLLLVAGSCKKESKNTPDPNTLPVVTFIENDAGARITNTLGKPNQFITLLGHRFDPDFKNSQVLFGKVSATPIDGDSIRLRVAIPDDAPIGQLKLSLVTNGQTVVHPTPYFIVEAPDPKLTGLSSATGMNGSQLVISGTNFSTNAAKTTVTIGGQNATVQKAGLTAIQVKLPAQAVNGKVVVTTHGVTLTAAQEFKALRSTFSLFAAGDYSYPRHLSTDAAGNLYGTHNNTVLKIGPDGRSTVLATIGTWNDSRTQLDGCVADAAGNVYVSCPYDLYGKLQVGLRATSSKIYKITPGGQVQILAGDAQGYQDGLGSAARFMYPGLMTSDRAGNLYVYDWGKIRKISASGQVTTLATNVSTVTAMTMEPGTDNLYILEYMDYNYNTYELSGRIRKIAPDGSISTPVITPAPGALAGSLFPDLSLLKYLGTGFATSPTGRLLVICGSHVYELKNGALTETYLNPTTGIAIAGTFDATGKFYLTAPLSDNLETVFKIDLLD